MFNNKTLLITGGTGSFGNAVLNRFLDTDIKEIRIFSRDEKKQDDMRHRLNNPKVKFYIGDVRNKRSVDYAMNDVDFIFHAAFIISWGDHTVSAQLGNNSVNCILSCQSGPISGDTLW